MSETAQFVDAAVSLAPQIRALAGEIDQFRRLPPSLVDAITRAGLFRLLLPRSLGGHETDPMTFVRVVEEVHAPTVLPAGVLRSSANMACSAAICLPKPQARFMAATRMSGLPASCVRRGRQEWLKADTG